MIHTNLLRASVEVMEAAIKSGDWVVDGACDPTMLIEAIKKELRNSQPVCILLTPKDSSEDCFNRR